jgi:tetratricopeptide (TPR) repeat protein
MGAEAALDGADALVFTVTGKHLNDLQRTILREVRRRRTYRDIAYGLRYTEGHIKDVASQLWQTLSQALGERVTKGNCWSVLERRLPMTNGSPNVAPNPVLSPAGNPSTPAPDSGLGPGPNSDLASPVPSLSHSVPLSETPAPALLGRQGAIAHLQTCVNQGHRALVIQGEGGVGKTTLAQQFLTDQPFALVLELLMAKETANITPAEQVVEEWLRQDFQVEPGRDFGVTLGRLRRQLRDRPVGILIDNLEPALDSQGRFWPQHSRYGDLLRVLCDPRGQAVTLLTSRDRLCEPGVSVTHYRLPGLAADAWRVFFNHQGIDLAPSTLAKLHQAYGGNAKAMHILSSAIANDFGGDGDAYWRENGDDPLVAWDLKNLVASQIQRLQRLDPAAYQVFCRLGVYRYQDVPRIPRTAIEALMGDLDPDRHRQVITSLRNRSLLEGHQGHYWLHPVVQAAALNHLRQQPSGERQAHTQAAQFWTQSVPTLTCRHDALQALEAYYHHWAIADYEAAAAVLLHSRPNQWGQHLTLGSSLYRLGLLQPVLSTIPPLLPHLPADARASELRNILADGYWIAGKIRAAIALQTEARAIALEGLGALPPDADPHERYRLKMLAVDALLSLGLYHLALWELDHAADWFHQVMAAAEGTAHQSWADKAALGLALVLSAKGETAKARPLAARAYDLLAQDVPLESAGRFAFFIQLLGQTYTNLGDDDRAEALYQRAIAFAKASHYGQVEAQAQVGLGVLACRHRQGAMAIATVTAAIARLSDLEALSDLGEAHFQRGLIHQAQGDTALAERDFAAAIQQFTAVDAPKQVARIRHHSRTDG